MSCKSAFRYVEAADLAMRCGISAAREQERDSEGVREREMERGIVGVKGDASKPIAYTSKPFEPFLISFALSKVGLFFSFWTFGLFMKTTTADETATSDEGDAEAETDSAR